MKQFNIQHTDASYQAYQTLKDHSINVTDFIRKALIEKAKELKQ